MADAVSDDDAGERAVKLEKNVEEREPIVNILEQDENLVLPKEPEQIQVIQQESDAVISAAGHVLEVKYTRCSIIYRVILGILLLAFVALPLACLYWMFMVLIQPSTFYGNALKPAVLICGIVSLTHQISILGCGVVQILQLGTFHFVNKCRVFFNCALVSYCCNLLFLLPLAIKLSTNIDGRIEDMMRDTLKNWNNRWLVINQTGNNEPEKVIDSRWERTQETYKCCGFGGYMEYKAIVPESCCAKPPCHVNNTSEINCFTSDAEVGDHSLSLGIKLLWIPIPAILVLFIVFRCFTPFWTLHGSESWTSVNTLSPGFSDDDLEDEHRDFKYVKVRSHISTDVKQPEVSWQRKRWRQISKQALANDAMKARMFYLREKDKHERKRFESRLEEYRQLQQKRDQQKLN